MEGKSGTGGGERVAMGGRLTHVQEQHVARYQWAAEQAHGQVLDVACGTGYGTAMLDRVADAEGLEGSDEALREAAASAPGVRFAKAVLPVIPRPDETFDQIVCFETIEHVNEDVACVAEMWRVLKPGGELLVSTPNKEVDSPDGPPANDYHFREYRLPELLALLEDAGFERSEVFGQYPAGGTLLERQAYRLVARFPVLCRPGRWWDRLAHGEATVEPWDDERQRKYIVIRARKPV